MTTYEPTEYDQHVAAARHQIMNADGDAGAFAAVAVAEATLAAAEQARIGNLIAIARYNTDEINRGAEGGLTATVDQMARLADLQEVIREALGLPSPWTEQSGPPLRNPPGFDADDVIEYGAGVYECDACGLTFDDDHYGDVQAHQDETQHGVSLRHRKAGE